MGGWCGLFLAGQGVQTTLNSRRKWRKRGERRGEERQIGVGRRECRAFSIASAGKEQFGLCREPWCSLARNEASYLHNLREAHRLR
ncbi:hypothetical protein LIA77_06093 [Sarocladium implicatum]|nr:hypothetical protein LIA77_06093 [Sarocladium implicatum]